jgi:ABC-type uncharacterized transport system ATPase subunit
VSPDRGEVLLGGKRVPLGNPAECKRLGIQLVHQHFTLVPQFTGEENLALGNMAGTRGTLRLGPLTEPAKAVCRQLGWDLRFSDLVQTYSVGEQQRLEILRALSLGGDVILFDEPTAVLSPDEVDDLLGVLRKLRDSGKIVILIAHKLSEVLAVADRVTVLRRGRRIAGDLRVNVDAGQLAEWMVGEMPPLSKPESFAGIERSGLVAADLTVRGSRGELAVRSASFTVDRGEILGIGGVDGNGQIELAEALAGVRAILNGSTEFELKREGYHVAYIPQDRQRDGLAMGMSVSDNLLVTGHRKPELVRGMFLRPRRIDAWVRDLIRRFEIKVRSPKDLVSSLSGGNGQKVVVSRSLDRLPDLLVSVNPTRGLDIKASAYVHEKIREAAGRGAAVVLISTDSDELAALASRRVFMSRGQISHSDRREDFLGGDSS